MKVISIKKSVESKTEIVKPRTKLEKLREFKSRLSEDMSINPNDCYEYYFNKELSVRNGDKVFRQKGCTYQIGYQNQNFRLSLTPLNSNTIEIWWIQVFNKGNGLGSDIMNNILDISDEMGIGVKVIPVDIDNEEMKVENLYRLRNWYKSFGFKSRNFNRTPELYYEPQTEQLKQVS